MFSGTVGAAHATYAVYRRCPRIRWIHRGYGLVKIRRGSSEAQEDTDRVWWRNPEVAGRAGGLDDGQCQWATSALAHAAMLTIWTYWELCSTWCESYAGIVLGIRPCEARRMQVPGKDIRPF